jgi:hypothetical protein
MKTFFVFVVALYGTVFKMNTDGTGFSVLKTFAGGTDGSHPQGRLVLAGTSCTG